jgi:hypothetical protein
MQMYKRGNSNRQHSFCLALLPWLSAVCVTCMQDLVSSGLHFQCSHHHLCLFIGCECWGLRFFGPFSCEVTTLPLDEATPGNFFNSLAAAAAIWCRHGLYDLGRQQTCCSGHSLMTVFCMYLGLLHCALVSVHGGVVSSSAWWY